MENLKEMFVRWVVDNLDLKNVVKDVLLFGRFLLVVFQLYFYRIKFLVDDKK